MTFATDVRNELARVVTERKCCQKAELAALLSLRTKLESGTGGSRTLRTTAESAATARKIYSLLKETYGLSSTVSVLEKKRFKKSRHYGVELVLQPGEGQELLDDLGLTNAASRKAIRPALVGKNCCKRAYLRGIFINRGFINRPEGAYHLELVFADNRLPVEVQKLMHKLGLDAKISERKNSLLIYLKEGEKIVDFLRLVEASHALLAFENVRIVKSMRNQVNRQVNCETANLAKTVDASVRQVEMIEKLLAKVGLKGLPSSLRELALLRIDHPESTFKELGMLLDPPLTKSGVAYRMKKLENLATDLLET